MWFVLQLKLCESIQWTTNKNLVISYSRNNYIKHKEECLVRISKHRKNKRGSQGF